MTHQLSRTLQIILLSFELLITSPSLALTQVCGTFTLRPSWKGGHLAQLMTPTGNVYALERTESLTKQAPPDGQWVCLSLEETYSFSGSSFRLKEVLDPDQGSGNPPKRLRSTMVYED